MHEILRNLEDGALVLDLGSGATGSISRDAYPTLRIVRLDEQFHQSSGDGLFVQGDAARLAFRDNAFDAVISNHSLEHIGDLSAALGEIGRVLRENGSLYVSVPDASSLTDKTYRWLFAGGGHVNAITLPDEFAREIVAATGLTFVAWRVLHSSLIFLGRHRHDARPSRKLWLFGGGAPWFVACLTYGLRQCDRVLRTRWSVYGWAVYFGDIREEIDTVAWTNVCVSCGAGQSANSLTSNGEVRRVLLVIRYYRCGACGQWNLFTEDRLDQS